ncbi:uncharacterized protein LOC117382198 isoform X2 [Periophthalmus magnuspinnatus]|uniref:uncharacterized protein LOC117382198 isoform X2 n=1 Tax=Periophthalmus magnuspinnatus TaxID=409849 RepID=UPI0024362CCA|nr:uncharacterized protein LOC117382198 isoform X2 [Periophthalmus magnuspinnatus]
MSESIVRKVQPFTIGTRLSVPAVSKCQDFAPDYLQSPSLDNCTLPHNLNSLYLSRSPVCGNGPRVSPVQTQSAVGQEPDMAAEDHLNQNICSAAAVARSIKKITISGTRDRPENRTVNKAACVFVTGITENNNNNNNSSSTTQTLPRIVGVSCENKPKSQFKVLLRKESSDEQTVAQIESHVSEEQPSKQQQISSPESEAQRKGTDPVSQAEESPGVSSQTDCFTQRNSLFNKEALQAEAWIKGKLQDLKDGRNIERCPLQDWEEACQTLQRDLKDFENTLIQLNQMGEQLICKKNPTSDLVKKQLSQLWDQWQTLKQTAANQTRALGGAKNLQEFNTKVEKLEAWIKEKEEPTSLVNVLGESVDKMQLTRKILDLKQDEQLYRNLYEEINHLALKLEKQAKADGKNIGNRRKHVNKMYTWSFEMNWWLKVQAHLKNYHENLQLALEVSSFYQQADNILLAIHNMRKGVSASKEPDKIGDQEIRDIAGQIMMLDVSVSQLSNLHPALATGVIQKQSEIKESWALLQKTLRTDRAAPPPTSPTPPREEGDPSTREQGIVGTELQRTMGKEVKEEQNRLKGFVGTADASIGQTQEQDSVSLSSPMGEAAVCSNDVIARHQLKGESRKPKAEPKNDSTQPGHPPLHAQLQKFTVSADKTLAWLKDNVSMATQICSVASLEGPEAARRCQHALEQEILNNRTRIEVVKREGRGLVRAQHPGSSRIQEFLGQLEVLWEELRRRHQRNALFLQASEELGFRVVKVLQALGSLDAWLESVELSMKESSLAADPETMSVAERQSCLLEREVAARGHELSTLRQEVEQLQCHSHPLTRGLPARMDDVERKYQCVQSALTQQSSELQDTRMLTEFLEQVELEESQERRGGHFSLRQPLHSEMSPAPTVLDLRSSGATEPLMEPMGDPVEELREAVEMLNDTVRARGRSQNHDQAIRELLSKHASLAVHVEESLCRSKDLSLDILERETDMAVQCEPDRCGLDALWEEQDHLEINYEDIKSEVKAVEGQARHLEELCPERVHVFGAKIQATLQAWSELGASVMENKLRLREFVQLQDFFRSYLQMISWTEDTRSCIFSATALHHGKDGQGPMAAELDSQIEQKFEEFEELAATGRNILDKDHHLSQMVRERMEELRSMLGWISVHWRVQKQQWLQKQEAQDHVYSVMCSSVAKPSAPEQQADQSVYSPVLSCDEERQQEARETQNSSLLCKPANKQTEDGYEVMTSVPLHSPDVKSPESPKSSVFVLKDKSSPGLGNTVNLILSFGNTGDSQVQVLDAPVTAEEEEEGTSEPVRRVSTYLHVKENSLSSGPVYESITLPRLKSHSPPSPPPSPSTPPNATQMTNYHLSTGGSTSIFSSLKRIGKKRKRKRDNTRRHSIQKIMGVEEQEEEIPKSASEKVNYDTRTWPLKQGRRKKAKSPENVAKDYMKNPLLKDIESECTGEYNITPYAVSEAPSSSANHIKSHCRFLSLGSVLSFELPKDMKVIPSIQDIITIAPPDSKKSTGEDPDPLSQRQTALSSFKQTRPALAETTSENENATSSPIEKDTADNYTLKQQSHILKTGQCDNKLQVECSANTVLNRESDQQSNKIKNPIYVNHHPIKTCNKHECLSVHTLIKDLNGHKYHKCTRPHNAQGHSQASHMVVNLKSTVNVNVRQDSLDSGISSLGSVKLSSEIPSLENLQPKGIVGKMMSLDVGCIGNNKEFKTNMSSTSEFESEAVHVDHQQFEEVEEELEGIWSQNLRNSICSDIMYQPNQDETLSVDQPVLPSSPPASKSPAVLYRNLVTASAPNLLVAEFKLPPSVQSLLGYDKCPNRHLSSLAVGERRSWAAFPNRDPSSSLSSGPSNGTSVAVNETASDPVKLPEIEDSQRYIYQYREEEEEEREDEEEEHTSCFKGEEGNCQQTSPTSEHTETQDHTTATGERCIALRPELQSMEGTLERKQRLQLGGKKAASRGWSSYHTVLYRHTLCFYQDRKDILRSSSCGLPLNLIGAECIPAPEYTKKPNCFHLRLRDGSEYLLNASSRLLMKKWIMKIQANTGRPKAGSVTSGVCRDVDLPFSVSPSPCSRSPSSSPHEVTSTFPQLKPRGSAQTTITLREFSQMSQGHIRSTEEKQDPCSVAGGWAGEDDYSLTQTVTQTPGGSTDSAPLPLNTQDGLSNQRRSHSFTSATYQKISPVLSCAGGRGVERGSNYCVTLLVGDKSRDIPSVSRSNVSPVGEPSALRYYTSLPRPRNKSVFKKFFGRKDY